MVDSSSNASKPEGNRRNRVGRFGYLDVDHTLGVRLLILPGTFDPNRECRDHF
jgi:hypothetical protein